MHVCMYLLNAQTFGMRKKIKQDVWILTNGSTNTVYLAIVCIVDVKLLTSDNLYYMLLRRILQLHDIQTNVNVAYHLFIKTCSGMAMGLVNWFV